MSKSIPKIPTPTPKGAADLLDLTAIAVEVLDDAIAEAQAQRARHQAYPDRHFNFDTGALLLDGRPNLMVACGCCAGAGYIVHHDEGSAPRREQCTACEGRGEMLSIAGEALLSAIRRAIARQAKPDATAEAIEAANKRAAEEHKAQLAREAEEARKRAAELRGLADEIATRPGLFDQVRALLSGETK
jgi:hypothetical protein